MAHDTNNDCKIGDTVKIEESRPISRSKRWRVREILKSREFAELQPLEIDVSLLEGQSIIPKPKEELTAEEQSSSDASPEQKEEDSSPTDVAEEDVPTDTTDEVDTDASPEQKEEDKP